MKKILSLIIFGGLFLSFSCHNTALAKEGGHHVDLTQVSAISGNEHITTLKNCCDSISDPEMALLQKKEATPQLSFLPTFFSREALKERLVPIDPAVNSEASHFSQILMSTVKRE